jgi:sterol desaturase/sphingolipid hydroxylase (fatty acid hydroxylase superfamily)
MWYTLLGAAQFTVWEAAFLHCWASGRLPFLTDREAASTYWQLGLAGLAAFWVPLYRDFHFYFAHRFLHIKALYKYIHAVHHRNTDIEPFAGLSMHPIEHLYYFSCVGPSLLLFASPFALLWCGVHLLLSPAAGHSGWEDHFQASQYHYLHHR